MKLALSALAAISLCGTAFADTVHELKIGIFDQNLISKSAVEKTIAAMNDIMVESQPYSCSTVSFKLVSGPDPIIDSKLHYVGDGNFAKFSETGFSINIVSQILECGEYKVNVVGQSFGGCTTVGSKPVTVIPRTAKQRPMLWLHELGHSQGLRDRCGSNTQEERDAGCIAAAGYIMRGFLANTNLGLNQDECRAFEGEQNFPILVDMSEDTAEPSIVDLMHDSWNHAMPLDRILQFDADEVSQLGEIIRSSDTEAWPNAILALGLSGEIDQYELISSVLNAQIRDASTGEIDLAVLDAKLNVPIAIGYLANTTGSPEILLDLTELALNENNAQFFTQIDSPPAIEEYSNALARNAIIAFGMNPGTEMIKARVEEINFRFRNREIQFLDATFLQNIDDLSAKISEQGLISTLRDR